MNREESWPLIWFTALSPLAIGGLAGLLAVRGTPATGIDGGAIALLAVALLALLASLAHLGRPLRSYRSIARLSTSWLSREVALFGAFVFLLIAYALPFPANGWRGLFGILAIVVGALSLLATGEIYRLPARPSWNSWRTVASFILGALGAGLLLGVFLGQPGVLDHVGVPGPLMVLSGAALFMGVAITCLRLRRPDRERVEEFAAWEMAIGPFRWLIVLRIAGSLCALGLLGVAASFSALAWIPALIGEIADRVLFFHAVVPLSMARRVGAIPFDPVRVVEAPAGKTSTS